MFKALTSSRCRRNVSFLVFATLALGLSGCGLTQEDLQALGKHVKEFQEKKEGDIRNSSARYAYSDEEALAAYHQYRRQTPPLMPALYVQQVRITMREAKIRIGSDLLYINQGGDHSRKIGPPFSLVKILNDMDRKPFQLWPVHYKQAGVSGADIVRFANKRNMRFVEAERFVTKSLLNHAFHASVTKQIEGLRP